MVPASTPGEKTTDAGRALSTLSRRPRPGQERYEGRTGYGAGAGWQYEFETIRIRLTDFLRDGNDLDLGSVRSVRFDFGSIYGSAEGRVAIDDVELVKE